MFGCHLDVENKDGLLRKRLGQVPGGNVWLTLLLISSPVNEKAAFV